MGNKTKVLCEMKKADIADVIKIVSKPKYICSKCFRVAKDKEYLCSGKKI
jgi:hypothetical protein